MAEDTDKGELQRQLNELKWELRDARTTTINWWLSVIGFILTFFGIVVVIGGYVGFTRFQQIEDETRKSEIEARKSEIEARSILGEAQGLLEQIKQTKRTGDEILASWNDRILPLGDDIAKTESSQETIQKPEGETADTPLDAEAYKAQGTAKRKQGLLVEAITNYDQAIRLKPKFAEAYNDRGIAKERLGLFFEALTDYDKAIELQPGYPEAYNNRGNVKQIFGRFKEALDDHNQAIKLRSNYSNAYHSRAIAKESLGLVLEAFADYDKAIELQPDYPEIYYNRGKLKIASGFKLPGREDLVWALELAQRNGNTGLWIKAEQALHNIATIPSDVFKPNPMLEGTITIPSSVIEIPSDVFKPDPMLERTITIPSSVIEISSDAFATDPTGTQPLPPSSPQSQREQRQR